MVSRKLKRNDVVILDWILDNSNRINASNKWWKLFPYEFLWEWQFDHMNRYNGFHRIYSGISGWLLEYVFCLKLLNQKSDQQRFSDMCVLIITQFVCPNLNLSLYTNSQTISCRVSFWVRSSDTDTNSTVSVHRCWETLTKSGFLIMFQKINLDLWGVISLKIV